MPQLRTRLAWLTTLVLAVSWLLVGASPAQAASPAIWPAHTITYVNRLPPSYAWSVAAAVRSWNTSGINVRFVAARTGAVTIGFGDTHGNEGLATLGRQRGAYVHLAPGRTKVLPIESRGYVAELLAHELGHVLGLSHTNAAGCQLMHPIVGVDCPLADTYQYRCGWFGGDDLARARRLYGGRPRPGPRFCLLEPVVPRLRTVVFSGGAAAAAPVRISWVRPPHLPGSARIHIALWSPDAGTCSAKPRLDAPGPTADATLAPSATSWTEPAPDGAPHCYRVWVVSHLGQPTIMVGKVLTSYVAPPAAPVVTSLHDRGDASMIADATVQALPTGAWLVVRRGPAGACPATPTDGEEVSVSGSDTSWSLYVAADGPSCLSFFAVTSVTASAPTSVPLNRAPAPPAAVVPLEPDPAVPA